MVWQSFTQQRYLLEASYDLGDELRRSGYVSKPIVGRCGANISVFAPGDGLIESTGGRFQDRHQVHQTLWPLPLAEGESIQVSTVTVAGGYAGACVRLDPSLVITSDSDMVALRVVPDRIFLELVHGRAADRARFG